MALSADLKRKLLLTILESRLGDLREESLNRQGKGHFHVSGRGHEAMAAVGRLMQPDDYACPYYRDRAFVLGRGVTTPTQAGVKLEAMVDHIDHVCQLAGNARHAAVGTDLDGGFGTEQTPSGLDRISDLRELEEILTRRGYSEQALDDIFHGNWLRFFGENLPS